MKKYDIMKKIVNAVNERDVVCVNKALARGL